jgi:hypothetical protein
MNEEFTEKQSYWSYWVIEFNRRIDLGIEVLLTTFIVSFISLIAYFLGWGFFFFLIKQFIFHW